MTTEHEVIVKMVERIRQRLMDADQSYFRLDIEVMGDVHGKPSMCYKLGKSSYNSDTVEGNDIDAVLNEHLRRQGWKETNKPLELTFDEPETEVFASDLGREHVD